MVITIILLNYTKEMINQMSADEFTVEELLKHIHESTREVTFEWKHGGTQVSLRGSWAWNGAPVLMENAEDGIFRTTILIPEGSTCI